MVLHAERPAGRDGGRLRSCRRSDCGGSPPGSRAATSSSTAKPWFCEVISTGPVARSMHRLVGPAMAELQLERLGPAGQRQQLMAQADAEDRASCPAAPRIVVHARTSIGSGSPGPLERNTPSGSRASTSSAVAVPGRTVTRQPMSNQVPGDVPLHAVVERDDVRGVWPAPAGLVRAARRASSTWLSGSFHVAGFAGDHLATRSRPTRPGLALALATRLASSRSTVESTPFIAPWMRMRRTRARVSIAFDRHDAVRLRGSRSGSPRERKLLRVRLCSRTTKPARCGFAALDVLGVDAVVADLRVGHRDDLAAIAGIGEDLLVAGHRGVEADLAVDFARGAERGAGEDGSVFQSEFCGHACKGIQGSRVERRGSDAMVREWGFGLQAANSRGSYTSAGAGCEAFPRSSSASFRHALICRTACRSRFFVLDQATSADSPRRPGRSRCRG